MGNGNAVVLFLKFSFAYDLRLKAFANIVVLLI